VRITLAELELHRITASESYAPGAIDYHGADFRQVVPLKINATAELLGEDVRIHGQLATTLEASCDRCLGAVKIPIDQDFDLFYRPMETIAKDEEIELPEDELEIGFFSGDGIELADVAREQVILSMPMKVICKAECRGLCPVCRVNLNSTRCECTIPQQDSPFASLREG
jgi:uncharacterized protein